MIGSLVMTLPSRACSVARKLALPGSSTAFRTYVWQGFRAQNSCKPRMKMPSFNTAASSSQRGGIRTFASSGAGGGGSGAGRGTGGSGGAGDSSGSNKGENLWEMYLRWTQEYPLLTKGVTCAVLNAMGDLAAQVFVEKNEKIDTHRLLVFSTLGAFLVAPALHFWYGTLARVVTATGTKGALMRLAADQLAFAPFFNGVFISALFMIEGQSHSIIPKLKQDLVPTVKANWVLWVPAQYINFTYVPQNLQVLFANVVALAWNTYLSFASHKKIEA